jgi:flavin-dependent dehydrogenase
VRNGAPPLPGGASAGAAVDVAVMGAGTAGAVTALLLARAGCAVTLYERRAVPPPFRIGEGLPPTIHPLLARLRLLDHVRGGPHAPAYANRSAWGSDAVRDDDFIRHRHGHGFHLDRVAFDATLLSLAERAGARVERPARLAARPARDGGIWRLRIEGDAGTREVAARFVVDATGRGAAFARAAGVRREAFDRLVAFSCVLPAPPGPGDHATLTESFPQGWWYTAPLPGARRVVALLTDPDTPAARAARTADGFRSLLAATTYVRAAAGGAEPIVGPAAAGANSSRLRQVHGDGWLAVGDAALAFDPLSSQGLLTAIYCAEKAAAAAYHTLRGGADALPRYAALLDGIFTGYLHGRGAAYAAERRWPHEPFWQRRLSLSPVPP